MNGTRMLVSLAMVAFPAVALPAVGCTRRPRAWAFVLALSLGAGFVLFEASLVHAALPVTFTLLGLDRLAAACLALGGHILGDPAPFGALAGLLAVVVGVRAVRGAAVSVGAMSELRRSASAGTTAAIAGHQAILLPLRRRWAVALPGGDPRVVISSSLIDTLDSSELDAVVHHELAHLEHHHVRFLLLGTAVGSGLWFLPWSHRAGTTLRLALERWADEAASARSGAARAHVGSALRKLTLLVPSSLAGYRISALERPAEDGGRVDWGWPTAVTALVPLVVGLSATLVLHLHQVMTLAAGG